MIAQGLAIVMLSGCAAAPEPQPVRATEPQEAVTTVQQETPAPEPAPAPEPEPQVRADGTATPRVNPLRFNQVADLETTTVKIGRHEFIGWIMDDDSKRMEGMMHLEAQDFTEKQCMIFVYNQDREMSFWMKNTLVDLDIAFVNSKRVIVHTATMKSKDETMVPSRRPATYAIEFKAGLLKKLGIRPGMTVEFGKPLKSKD